MMALILAVGLMQATGPAEVRVSVTVVRPACVVVNPEGTATWLEGRRPGTDSVHCTRSSEPVLAAPRIASVASRVEGREARTVVIDY